MAEIERLPDQARTPGIAASYDEVTQMVNPHANPESVARRIKGTTWKLTDRSDSGCRLVAPAKEAPGKLGELLAIKEGEQWSLAVVRGCLARRSTKSRGCGSDRTAMVRS